jgi:chromatin remodeling complex protein RSC6
MAKKVSVPKTSTEPTTAPVEAVPVETKKKVVKKVVTKKKVAKTAPVETAPVETAPVETAPVETAPVETAPVETAPVETAPVETAPVETKKRAKKVTKEDVQQKWDELFETYKNELKVKKTSEQNVSLLKFLTSLKNDTFKALKLKTRNVSTTDKNNSGFMKPVSVSDELRSFIDIDNSDPITRVLITQKLCQYIKENNLQKPEDKREIIPDEKMKKLFDIQPNESEKLTYYSMQRRVQRHIFKLEV